MRTTLTLVRNKTKYGLLVPITRELPGPLLTQTIMADEKKLEWVMKSLCLAQLDLLDHWDDIECTVFIRHDRDIIYVKLLTQHQLCNELFSIPEGGEYPQRFIFEERNND